MISVGIDSDGIILFGQLDVSNVDTEFNYRNLATDTVLDAGAAIGTLIPVGDANDLVVRPRRLEATTPSPAPLRRRLSSTATTDRCFLTVGGRRHAQRRRRQRPTVRPLRQRLRSNGGADNDTLEGGSGNDTLDGGLGDDSLTGDVGIDTALWRSGDDHARTGTVWHVTDAGGTDTLFGVEIVDDSAAGKTLLVGLGGYAHHPGGDRRGQRRRHHPGRGGHLQREPVGQQGCDHLGRQCRPLPASDGGRGSRDARSPAASGSPPTASPLTASRSAARSTCPARPGRPESMWPATISHLVNSVLDGPTAAVNGDGNNSAVLTEQVTGLDVGDNLSSAAM